MGISLCRIEIKCVGINGAEISFADLWREANKSGVPFAALTRIGIFFAFFKQA